MEKEKGMFYQNATFEQHQPKTIPMPLLLGAKQAMLNLHKISQLQICVAFHGR